MTDPVYLLLRKHAVIIPKHGRIISFWISQPRLQMELDFEGEDMIRLLLEVGINPKHVCPEYTHL